jgi:hypothetical protein
MSSILCKLGIHDWNKYGDIINAYGGLTQFKSCKRCNKINYTEIYGNQAKSDQVNNTVKAASDNAH